MAEVLDNLEALKHPAMYEYSRDLFSNRYRIPVLGTVLELTPIPECDFIYPAQVAVSLSLPGEGANRNFRNEWKNIAIHGQMVRAIKPGENGFGIDLSESKYAHSTKNFYRTNSGKWEIVRAAVREARRELGI